MMGSCLYSKVFTRPDELEGAYRWAENLSFNEKTVGSAAHEACARRCANEAFVFVPLDGFSKDDDRANVRWKVSAIRFQ